MSNYEPETSFKRILKRHKLSLPKDVIEELSQSAADVYAHNTEDGWCCACGADKAFMYSTLQDEGWTPPPELSQRLAETDSQTEGIPRTLQPSNTNSTTTKGTTND